jgi:predicted DNA-binding antitoxin AbrB/MazE fold protein
MQKVIRARFSGRVIIPEEPLELPKGQSLEVIIIRCIPSEIHSDAANAQRAWQEIKATAIKGLHIPDEALRRECLYEVLQ